MCELIGPGVIHDRTLCLQKATDCHSSFVLLFRIVTMSEPCVSLDQGVNQVSLVFAKKLDDSTETTILVGDMSFGAAIVAHR